MGKLFSSTKRRERAPGSDINNVCLPTAPSLLIQGSLPCSQAIHTYGKTDCRVHLYEHHMYLLLHLRGLKQPFKMWDLIFRCFHFATFLFCIFVLIFLLFASRTHFVTLELWLGICYLGQPELTEVHLLLSLWSTGIESIASCLVRVFPF